MPRIKKEFKDGLDFLKSKKPENTGANTNQFELLYCYPELLAKCGFKRLPLSSEKVTYIHPSGFIANDDYTIGFFSVEASKSYLDSSSVRISSGIGLTIRLERLDCSNFIDAEKTLKLLNKVHQDNLMEIKFWNRECFEELTSCGMLSEIYEEIKNDGSLSQDFIEKYHEIATTPIIENDSYKNKRLEQTLKFCVQNAYTTSSSVRGPSRQSQGEIRRLASYLLGHSTETWKELEGFCLNRFRIHPLALCSAYLVNLKYEETSLLEVENSNLKFLKNEIKDMLSELHKDGPNRLSDTMLQRIWNNQNWLQHSLFFSWVEPKEHCISNLSFVLEQFKEKGFELENDICIFEVIFASKNAYLSYLKSNYLDTELSDLQRESHQQFLKKYPQLTEPKEGVDCFKVFFKEWKENYTLGGETHSILQLLEEHTLNQKLKNVIAPQKKSFKVRF